MKIAFLSYFRTSVIRPFIPHITDEDERTMPGMGGYGVTDLATELIRRGYELTVITMDPSVVGAPRVWQHGNVKYVIIPLRREKVLRDFYRRETSMMTEILRQEQPDVIHAHWTNAFGLTAALSHYPSLITLHDHPWDIVKYGGAGMLPLYFMTLYVYRKGKRFSAVAPSVCEYAKRHGARSVTLIPNVLNDAFLHETPAVGDHGTKPLIVSALNWTRLKNPKTALAGFHRVLSDYPDAELHLFGWQLGAGEAGERWARKNALEKNVTFHGMVENDVVRHWVANATIVLHTSQTESTSIIVAEAMAMGKPVVAGANAGALPWVLDNGSCGVLTDIRNPDAVGASLLRLLKDAELRHSLGVRARQRAVELFNPTKAIAAYQAVYTSLLEGHT